MTNYFLTNGNLGVMLILSGIALLAGFSLHEMGAKLINEITT